MAVSLLALEACTRHFKDIPVPSGVGLKLYEERIYQAGPAPDSVRVYLSESSYASARKGPPVFEAQDAGAVCYRWIDTNELEITMSGGFVDRVLTQWRRSDGRAVTVKYRGIDGCVWHPEK